MSFWVSELKCGEIGALLMCQIVTSCFAVTNHFEGFCSRTKSLNTRIVEVQHSRSLKQLGCLKKPNLPNHRKNGAIESNIKGILATPPKATPPVIRG